MNMETINAAYLIRVSTNQQEFESQIDQLNKVIKFQGDNIVVDNENIYAEKISGYTDSRKSLDELKNVIETGLVNRVYCIELTRLSRKPQTLINEYEWFCSKKCPIYFVNEDMWTMNPDTLIINNDTRQKIYGAALWGEQELEKIKQRTSRGRILKAQQGFFVGHVAFGYKMALAPNGKDKLIVINENEAEIVRIIFEKIAYDGYTTTSITRYLNDNNFNTKYNNWVEINSNKKTTYKTNKGIEKNKSDIKFTYATIKQILKNRWYIGERQYTDLTLQHEPIISIELFNLANSKLKQNKKIDNAKKTDRVYCLSNLFFCGRCGLPMYAHTTHTSSSYYCGSKETGKKCGDKGVSKENAEMLLMGIITRLSNGVFMDSYLNDYFKLEQSGIKNIQENITQLEIQNNSILDQNKTLSNAIAELVIQKALQSIQAVKINLEDKIKALENEYRNNEKRYNENISNIQLLTTQLKNDFDINVVLSRINDSKDLNQIAIVFHKVFKKVVLFNIDNNTALFQVEFNSNKTINVLYFRQKSSYNLSKITEIQQNNDTDFISNLNIEQLNTPQQIYFFDDRMIEYNSKSNAFICKPELIISTKSLFFAGDKLDFENYPYKPTDYTYIENGIVTINQIVSVLFYSHSLTYDLFYSVDSPEYKLRKQRYNELTKGKFISDNPRKRTDKVIDKRKAFEFERKSLYQKRYKISINNNISLPEKNILFEEIENKIEQLYFEYGVENRLKKRKL